MKQYLSNRKELLIKIALCTFALTFLMFLPDAVASTGTDLPFTSTLQKLVDALSGTIAKVLITLSIIIGGLVWAYSERGQAEGAKKVGQAIVGGAIVFGAVGFMDFLGFTGGLV